MGSLPGRAIRRCGSRSATAGRDESVNGSAVPVHVFIGLRQTRWLSELKRNYPLLLKFSIELVGAAAEVAGLVVPRLVQQLRTQRTQREEL